MGDDLPHPIGSSANARVRAAIVQRLKDLGYEPQLQSGLVCSKWAVCGTPTNIVVTLQGATHAANAGAPAAAADDAVLLAAHYDSVPAGPGASDDGAGVAIVLEIARILAATPAARHPIVLLLTDGEEAGLLGALLFVREHPLAKQVKAAVNLDSRGVSGPSLMFETGTANAWALNLYRSAIRTPITNSLYYVVYKSLPNDTDFTVFKAASYQGLNFAFIGDVAHYHTPLDNFANLSLSSIQHQGDNALSALEALAGAEGLDPPIAESVYFDAFAQAVIAWPARLALPAALLALGCLFAEALLLFRGRALDGRQALWGATGALLTLILGAIFGLGSILLLRFLGKLPPADAAPWIAYPLPMSIAAAFMALLAAAIVGAWFARRAGFWGFWMGGTLLIALLSVIFNTVTPAASFAPLLASLAAALAALPCILSFVRSRPPTARAADFAVLLPCWVLSAVLAPMLLLLYSALGTLAWPITTHCPVFAGNLAAAAAGKLDPSRPAAPDRGERCALLDRDAGHPAAPDLFRRLAAAPQHRILVRRRPRLSALVGATGLAAPAGSARRCRQIRSGLACPLWRKQCIGFHGRCAEARSGGARTDTTLSRSESFLRDAITNAL